MAANYRRGTSSAKEIKNLREQVSRLAAEKHSAEESYNQRLAQMRESADGSLAARLAAEEKLHAAENDIRALRRHLSANQDSLTASMKSQRKPEEAKSKAEQELDDLQNELASKDAILAAMKDELEVQAVDRFKRSPAFDALLLREFERGMRQSKKFFAMRDHSNDKALKRFNRNIDDHMKRAVDTIKKERKLWRAHCRFNRTEPHPMHLEVPTKSAFNTYYSGVKGNVVGLGVEPDLGPIAGRDYEPYMSAGEEDLVWPSEDEIDEEDTEEDDPPANAG